MTYNLISTRDEYITSGFRTKQRPDHDGVDIVSAVGTQKVRDVYILAFADGVVALTGKGVSVGNWVDIKHEGKILTRYYHMQDNSIRVKAGQAVKKGDIVGTMGATGHCIPAPTKANPRLGTHLHFGVKENSNYYNNGVYVDPMPYLKGEKTIKSATVVQRTAPAVITNTSFKAGDKVKVLKAITYDGTPFSVWHSDYDVIQVSGDRVVIGKGKVVTAAVKADCIVKV